MRGWAVLLFLAILPGLHCSVEQVETACREEIKEKCSGILHVLTCLHDLEEESISIECKNALTGPCAAELTQHCSQWKGRSKSALRCLHTLPSLSPACNRYLDALQMRTEKSPASANAVATTKSGVVGHFGYGKDLLTHWPVEKKIEIVKLALASDPTHYFFLYAHPYIVYPDLIAQGWERAIQDLFTDALRRPCEDDEVMIDIGANAGIYSMYAASKGCKTHTFDPQPTCGDYIRAAALINGFQDVVNYYMNPVGIATGNMSVSYQTTCSGIFPVEEYNSGNPNLIFAQSISVPFINIDKMFGDGKTRVRIAKIDTEGAEYYVMESMLGILEKRICQELMIEISPMFWPQNGIHDKGQVARLLEKIVNWGYRVRILERFVTYTVGQEFYQWIMTTTFDQVNLHFVRI